MINEEEAPSSKDEAEKPSAIEKTPAPGSPLADRAEISHMRTELIHELKTPFIERVNASPSYSYIKQVKIENFDERIMTLSDQEIFDLHSEYIKTRRIKDRKKKEDVREGILKRLEMSILSDGSFLRRILRQRKA